MTTKAPHPGVRVTVEKFFGPSRLLEQIDIHCRDAQQVEDVGNLLIGMTQTEKHTAEAKRPESTNDAGK